MRNKIEIKVYLPIKMVGELEERNKQRRRSKFIEGAIRSRLDGSESFKVRDVPTKQLLHALLHRDVSEFVKGSIALELKE
jgi:metal-responsive CopG/Arc/MetJ family transcriptional regulator